MNRPDLDAIESEDLPAGVARWVKSLVAYARHLEDDRIKRIGRINELVMEGERAKNRISELETALEPFEQAYQREATIRNLPGGAYENAARVLRKGE